MGFMVKHPLSWSARSHRRGGGGVFGRRAAERVTHLVNDTDGQESRTHEQICWPWQGCVLATDSALQRRPTDHSKTDGAKRLNMHLPDAGRSLSRAVVDARAARVVTLLNYNMLNKHHGGA